MIRSWRGHRYINHHFFFVAFCAAFVVVPETSFGVTDLITPTATVCLMSRTAKRPRGGKSENASTHIGLLGTNSTMPASPDLIDFGLLSVDFPVRRSTFSLISLNLQ